MAFACLLVPKLQGEPARIQYASLADLLEEGTAAFARGNYPAAASAFNLIRTEYDEEAAWLETPLPKKLLPLAGFASLKSGAYDASIAALEFYLSDYADNATSKDFVLYTLAVSYLKSGNAKAAIDTFGNLRDHSTNDSLAGIATHQLARLLPPAEGIVLIEASLKKKLATRVATQMRLSLIRMALENGNPSLASTHLLDTNWTDAQMPELATLSFLAFQLGDLLLPDQPKRALRAYRIVTPKGELVQKQKHRLAQLERLYRDRSKGLAVEKSMWADFYREIILSLRHQLEVLSQAEDYQSAIDLRKAQCLQALGRNMEAWLLLERLSLAHDPIVSEIAHKQWISIARSMLAWSASAAIAKQYIKRYPNNKDVVEALYWIGQAQLEQKRFNQAARTFETLSQNTTDPSFLASANYLSGYALFMAKRPQAALEKFARAIECAPALRIGAQAHLWTGIVQFMLEEWSPAESAFEQVLENPAWTSMHPEAAFRLATCRYAQGKVETAKSEIEKWIQIYPNHIRRSEALLLQGDMLFAEGNNAQAETAYRAVDPEERTLRFYAISNLANLLDTKKRHAQAIILFEQYSHSPIPDAFIGPFYTLWSTALAKQGQQSEATALLKFAITSHGQNPHAEGITDLIQSAYANNTEPLKSLVENAIQDAHPTLAARYLLASARIHEQQGHVFEKETDTLRLVSDFDIDSLSPSCLAAAGRALLDIKSNDSELYFNKILDEYPFSKYDLSANFGLAKRAFAKGKFEAALSFLSHAEHEDGHYEFSAFKATLLGKLGHHQEAIDIYNALLANRSLSHKEKALTLFNLGNALLATEQTDSAYGCFERLFTLYRGEKALVAESYYQCARILSWKYDYAQAASVCSELLSQDSLSAEPAYRKTEALNQELAAQLTRTKS